LSKIVLVGSKYVIEFEDADIYQDDTLVLSKVDFKLATAETCYIIGRSGSGKTSFLKTIFASLPLKAGRGRVGSLTYAVSWSEIFHSCVDR
jgi:cell division transport system ATP-binding protein